MKEQTHLKILFTAALLSAQVAVGSLAKLNRYATKTSYNNSFTSTEFEAILQHGFSAPLQPSFCTPVQLNMVMRHGIRNPSMKDIMKVGKLYKKFLQSTNEENLVHQGAKKLYDNWQPIFESESEKALTSRGVVEVRSIASRFKHRFPELLQSHASKLSFVSSDLNRTIGTCEAFSEVLTGGIPNLQSKNTPSIRNDLIRFFDACEKYTKNVEMNPRALKEFHKFKTGQEYEGMAQQMSVKLNISDIKSDIKSVYIMAASEEAVHGSSLWSALLDEEDLRVLEYAKDLKDYWKKSYGHSISYEQSCPLLKDVFQHMQDAVNGKDYNTGIIRCAHAETILPFLALLGLFQDEEALRASDFRLSDKRQFATSRICPFSANIAFVLYECSPPQGSPNIPQPEDIVDRKPGVRYPVWPPTFEKYMVQLLYNELPVQFPFCEYDLCPYSQVNQHYRRKVENCDLGKLCQWSYRHSEL